MFQPETKRGQLSREQNKPSEEAKRTKLKETMTKLAHKRLALALRHKVSPPRYLSRRHFQR